MQGVHRRHLSDQEWAAKLSGEMIRVFSSPTQNGVCLTGGLLGGPVPRGGKQLVLEARSSGGPWIAFDVLRTDRRGRYRDVYRFKLPGPADYGFRALSESEADYPFATGASNVVRVRER